MARISLDIEMEWLIPTTVGTITSEKMEEMKEEILAEISSNLSDLVGETVKWHIDMEKREVTASASVEIVDE